MYTQKELKSTAEYFENRPPHGYVHKKDSENNNNDQKRTGEWTTNNFMTLHFEAYAYTIFEKEIGMKDLIHSWKNYINRYQQQITNVDCVRKNSKMLPTFYATAVKCHLDIIYL